MAEVFWSFNVATRQEVSQRCVALFQGQATCGVHVRRGDKISEHEYVPIEHYVQAVRKLPVSLEDYVLIASDDKSAADQLAHELSGFCRPVVLSSGSGYDQGAFNRESRNEVRRAKMTQLFAEIELLRSTGTFIGSSTSNLFYLVGYLRGAEGCIDLSDGGWLPEK
jgi:hypothetical protein